MRRFIRKRILHLFGLNSKIPKNVKAEDGVVLNRCVTIGDVRVGYKTYANDTLLRNVDIGRFCSIGRRCSIGAATHPTDWITTHNYGTGGPRKDFSPQTQIGNDVWIGDNVVILSGVRIGDGAIIGAGAVVTKEVCPYEIVVGVPAKRLRSRFDERTVTRLLDLEWWKYGTQLIDGIDLSDVAAAIAKMEERAKSLRAKCVL